MFSHTIALPKQGKRSLSGGGARSLRRLYPLYLMMIPGLAYLLINNYFPIIGLVLSFQKINYADGIFRGAWVGLENFEYLFATKDAWIITRNTVGYNLAFIVLSVVMGVSTAIMLNEIRSKFFSRAFQTMLLMPYLISWLLVAFLLYGFLGTQSGVLNRLLMRFGMNKISWYNMPKYWPFIICFVTCWRNTGYSCILYLSSIVGIDPAYYESASLDGASKWQQIRLITLPLLRPTISFLVLLSIGSMFYSDFGLFYRVPMDSGILYPVTNTIDTYVYRALLVKNNLNMSTAASCYQSVVGFLLLLISNGIVRRIDRDNAIF